MPDPDSPAVRILLALESSLFEAEVYVLVSSEMTAHPLHDMYCLADVKIIDSVFIGPSQKIDSTVIIQVWIDFQQPFPVLSLYGFRFSDVFVLAAQSLSPLTLLSVYPYISYANHKQTGIFPLQSPLILRFLQDVLHTAFHKNNTS